MKQLKTVDVKGKAYVTVNERIKYFREHSDLCLAGEDKSFINKFMTKEGQTIFKPAIAEEIFNKDEIFFSNFLTSSPPTYCPVFNTLSITESNFILSLEYWLDKFT